MVGTHSSRAQTQGAVRGEAAAGSFSMISEPRAGEHWLSAAKARLQVIDSLDVKSNTYRTTDVCEALETEIEGMARALAHMRCRLNAHQPIARLLPEILALVFEFQRHIEAALFPDPFDPPESDEDEAEQTTPRLGWIRVSHVCHYWREVALSVPALWSDITFSLGDEWMFELLRRSMGVPIRIDAWDHSTTLQTVVQKNIHRIHTLQILDFEGPIEDAFAGHAPLLHILRIGFHGNLGKEWPESLLEGGAPHLRTLFLRDVRQLPWHSPLLHNLNHVTIQHGVKTTWGEYDSPITVQDFLAGLRRIPHLQYLELSTKWVPNNAGEGPWEPVHLPHLSFIVLKASRYNISLFLTYLRWTASTKFILELSHLDSLNTYAISREKLEQIFASKDAHLQGMRAMRIEGGYFSKSVVSVWRDDRLQDVEEADLTLHIPSSTNFSWKFPHGIPLENIRTLILSSARSSHLRDLWEFCHVEHIIVKTDKDIQRFCSQIYDMPESFLPELISLNFGAATWSDGGSSRWPPWTSLLEFVRDRKEEPNPLENVWLHPEVFNAKEIYPWVEELAELVTVDTW